MSKQPRSIAYRLRRASTTELKQQILRDWLRGVDTEINTLISQLGQAIARDDFDSQSRLVGELREVVKKRLTGLKSIFSILTDEKKSELVK